MQYRWRGSIVLPFLIALASVAVLPRQVGAQSLSARAAQDARVGASKDWPLVGGESGSSRHSVLAQINTKSVRRLGAAWISKKFDDGASSRVTPVVHDGVMFVSAGTRVYALDAKSGERLWIHQTGTGIAPDPSILGASAQFPSPLPNTQGVAVGEGKVFVGLTSGRILALDEKAGKPLWTQDVRGNQPRRTQPVSAAPVYANGVVFGAPTTPEFFVGQVVALSAQDGRELWRFHTIPGPGEPGHETWPQNSDAWRMGGGNVWLAAAVDPDLGLVYWATGNATPSNAGELRPGDNLYTNSVIALDIKTGKLRWHQQVVHHDLWDTDIATPLVLYQAQVKGRPRKGLAAMRSDGSLFFFDRETGEPLIPIEERPVPGDELAKASPTQPYAVGVESVLSDCSAWKGKIPAGYVLSCSAFTPPTVESNVLAPSTSVRVQPMSFNPQTGYFYAQGLDGVTHRRRAADPYYWLLGGRVPGLDALKSLVLAAIDSRNGKVVWKQRMPQTGGFGGGGGVLTTAGGLLFHRRGDGNLEAFDAKSGNRLWRFQTGRAGGDASPITYEVADQQYVAVVEGTEVWAFTLGGDVPPRPAPAMPAIDKQLFAGPVVDASLITATSLLQQDIYAAGTRYYVDEYAFNPYRARVRVGAPVVFANNGNKTHTFKAQDGSWSTGTLRPNETATVKFDKPGEHVYICEDHPFTYGQLIVVEEPAISQLSQDNAANFAAQAQRGGMIYMQSCSNCHGRELEGVHASPPLAGSAFVAKWQGHSADELFDKMRATMPAGSPGSLGEAAYLDLTAYMLQANELLTESEALKRETLAKVSLRSKKEARRSVRELPQ